MRPFLLTILVLSAGCTPRLTGERGFTVGRAQLVPCQDESGDEGGLLIVESLIECWPSVPAERPSCAERRAQLAELPVFCSDNVVVESPSEHTLTGYFGAPLDPTNYLAAATTKVWDLPCNPAGQFAEGYPDYESALSEYTGDVRVIKDNGETGRLSFELYLADGTEPALEGEVPVEFCRDEDVLAR